MANNCYFKMKIVGSIENVKKFEKILCAPDYSTTYLFSVIYVSIDHENEICGKRSVSYSRTCAWSCSDSMLCKEISYYGQNLEDKNPDPNITTIQIESERLNLGIELYSEEVENGFQEHIFFLNGKEIENERVDCRNYFIDDPEDLFYYNEEHPEEPLTMAQVEAMDDPEIKEGGFEEWNFSKIFYLEKPFIEITLDKNSISQINLKIN